MVRVSVSKLEKLSDHNPVYSLFSKIPTPFRFLITILVLFLIIPVRLLAETLPEIAVNLAVVVYLWILINTAVYSVVTSLRNDKRSKLGKRITFLVSCITTFVLIFYSCVFVILPKVQEIGGPLMLKSKTSVSEEYTVKIFGNRDSPFSGYNGEVYLYNNLTGEKDYVCDLVDAHYLYIRWESEYVFSVNNRRFEIKQGNITSLP